MRSVCDNHMNSFLIGRLSLLALVMTGPIGCNREPAPVTVVTRDASFLYLSNEIVVDIDSRLMWSAKDNGKDISFEHAKAYVGAFRLAGYVDWRFPTLQELETLLVEGSSNDTSPGTGCSGNYDIHAFIRLTCCCPWALQDNGTRPASFPFVPGMATGTMWHHKSGSSGNRILPVRDLEANWQSPKSGNSRSFLTPSRIQR